MSGVAAVGVCLRVVRVGESSRDERRSSNSNQGESGVGNKYLQEIIQKQGEK